MTPFTTVAGALVPLMKRNVDTDVIVRIERLTTLSRDRLGPYAFEALRYRPDGSLDPDCVLNQAAFLNAPVLIADDNFGCGSSREGAVWALMAIGVRCVIAPSYGDIFYSNCFQNGVLPIVLPRTDVLALAAQGVAGAVVTVDLANRCITAPDGSVLPFTLDALRREQLLHGLDDIGLTLKDDALIREWQQLDRATRPWIWQTETRTTA